MTGRAYPAQPWFLKWMFVSQNYLVSWLLMVLDGFWCVFDVFLIHLHIHVVYQCHNAYHTYMHAYITLHYIPFHLHYISIIPRIRPVLFRSPPVPVDSEDAFRRKTNTKFSLWRFKCAFSDPQPQPCRWWLSGNFGAERGSCDEHRSLNVHGEIVEICWEPGSLMWMYLCDSICLWKTIFGW